MSVQLALAIYGALLSTALGTLTILKFLRERPWISTEAIQVLASAAEGDDTHGVLMRVQRDDDVVWEEADIEIRVRNAGAQACQITDVFIETAAALQQVRPVGLPMILNSNTSCSVRVQPEYFAPKTPRGDGRLQEIPVEAVGVIDALGKQHRISKENLTTLMRWCHELPLRTALYKHKETGNVVVAFQAKDPGTMIPKK